MTAHEETNRRRNKKDFAGEMPVRQSAAHSRKPVSQEGVEKLRQFQEQLLRMRGGKLFEDSVELLRQGREECMKELMGNDYQEDN